MDIFLLIIGIIIVILIILLITNYIKINQFSASQSFNNINELFEIKYNQNTNNSASQNNDKLVLYYTDWCQASQQFKPIWDMFKKNSGTDITKISINCEKDNNKCQITGIKGYPTVILHKSNGENIQFNGSRTVQSLEDFVNQNK